MRNIKNISRHDVIKIGQWCKTNLGTKNCKPAPQIKFYHKRKYEGWLGMYDWDDNVIEINKDGHSSVLDLIDTMVHEWSHYLQPSRQFNKRDEEHGYDENPYEVEANHRASIWKRVCYKEVFR